MHTDGRMNKGRLFFLGLLLLSACNGEDHSKPPLNVDRTAPQMTTVVPAPGTSVSPTQTFEVTFSEEVTLPELVRATTAATEGDTPQPLDMDVSLDGTGTIVTVIPRSPMPQGITRLSWEGLVDVAGNGVSGTVSANWQVGPSACVSPRAGMVSSWPGEGNAIDIVNSVDGNRGTLQNGTTFEPGKVGRAFRFDGVDDFVQIEDSPSLDFTSQFTIEAWILPRAFGNDDGTTFIALKGDNQLSTTQSYGLVWAANSSVFFRVGSATEIDHIEAVIPLDTFTHVAGTYDGATLKLYINGKLRNTKATSIGALQNTSFPLLVGSSLRNGEKLNFFNGMVDELSIYDSALSDADVTAIFNAGTTGKCVENSLVGPIAYLSFEDSPFNGVSVSNFLLEDFEDHALNTTGVSALPSTAFATTFGFSSTLIDSVDADDGFLDGVGFTGGKGDSFFSGSGSTGIAFTFDADALGGLPTHAGIVWTDGSGTTSFEAFDATGVSLGGIGPVSIADGNFLGASGEDRFFGVTHASGISKIIISNTSGGIEVDHLQYGR